MDGLMREGAEATHGLRHESRNVAAWLWDWAGPGYGPRGSHKLVVAGPDALVLASSPATALREADPAHPGVAPYVRLATNLQAVRGDGATTAVLLAAAVVRHALEEDGNPMPLLDGVAAARRQCLAVLVAHARLAAPEALLLGVVPDRPHWAPLVVDGLRRLGEHGRVDLDAVDVRPEPVDDLEWSDGLVVEPDAPAGSTPRDRTQARVAIVHGVRERTATDATLRLRAPGTAADDRWTRTAEHVAGLGIDLLLSKTALPEELHGRLLDRGVLVQQNVSKPLAWRVGLATGAEPAPTPESLTADDLGVADLHRRPPRRGGWSLHGPGAAATLHVPLGPGRVQEARVDDVERLLRAAGAVLEDPRGVAGGGQWQKTLEDSVAAMVPHLGGRAQLGARAVARALRDLRRALVRNAGLDPLDVPLPPAPEGLLDPLGVVRDAVDGALGTADALLRLDGRYRKRGSTATDLRGGTGPAGSPKGMPGDVPPLM